jgi:hypothetical protein
MIAAIYARKSTDQAGALRSELRRHVAEIRELLGKDIDIPRTRQIPRAVAGGQDGVRGVRRRPASRLSLQGAGLVRPAPPCWHRHT